MRRTTRGSRSTVTWRGTFFVGAAQALALIPGFSRSGATMGGGLLDGPLEQGRGALRVPAGDADHPGARRSSSCRSSSGRDGNGVRGQALVGALCSAATAYLAVRFLMRYFETQTLMPFAIYCFGAGLACSIYFAVN